MNSTPINRKLVEQSISKSAKKVIAESGMNPSTRSGSKALEHLVKRLAEQPFNNLAAAIQAGEELGQKIVELSQQMGKQNLDQGVIRQLRLKKQFPSASLSQATAQSASKPAQPKAQPTSVEKPTEPSAQVESTTESETAAQAVTTLPDVTPAAEPAVASLTTEEVEAPIEASGDSVYETVDEATDDDDSGEERATDDLTDESDAESLIADETLDSEDTKAEVGAIDDTEASNEQIEQLNRENASTELSLTIQTDAEDHPEIDDTVSTADAADTSDQASLVAPIAENENLDAAEETEAIAEDEDLLEEAEADDVDNETTQAAEPVDSVSDDELDDELDDADDTAAEKPAPPKNNNTSPVKARK